MAYGSKHIMDVMHSLMRIAKRLTSASTSDRPSTSATGSSVAREAADLVHGLRQADYGHPIFDLTRTADVATAILRSKLRPGVRLEAEDIAKLMVGVKLSRETFKPKRDNRVDGCGYFEVLDVIVKWREDNPGKEPRDCY